MTTQSQSSPSDAPVVEGRCMKCKKQMPMQNPVQSVMSNGRSLIRGFCASCGTKMNRIGTLPVR